MSLRGKNNNKEKRSRELVYASQKSNYNLVKRIPHRPNRYAAMDGVPCAKFHGKAVC